MLGGVDRELDDVVVVDKCATGEGTVKLLEELSWCNQLALATPLATTRYSPSAHWSVRPHLTLTWRTKRWKHCIARGRPMGVRALMSRGALAYGRFGRAGAFQLW